MDRVIADGTVPQGEADTVPGSGTPAFFTSGNPETSTPATVLPGYWVNLIMEEVRNIVVACGITPSGADLSQCWQAILGLHSYVDSGTTNAIVISPRSPLTLSSLVQGQEVTVLVQDTNTSSAVTIDFGGLVNTVTRLDTTALQAGDILGGLPTKFYFDGARWRCFLNGAGGNEGGGPPGPPPPPPPPPGPPPGPPGPPPPGGPGGPPPGPVPGPLGPAPGPVPSPAPSPSGPSGPSGGPGGPPGGPPPPGPPGMRAPAKGGDNNAPDVLFTPTDAPAQPTRQARVRPVIGPQPGKPSDPPKGG